MTEFLAQKPLHIFQGTLSGSWYATNRYKDRPEGGFEAQVKEDVTPQIERLLEWATESLEQDIAALEAENAALREFVAADDTLGAHVEAALTLEDVEVCRQMSEKKATIRQRLATDHGLPLPGAGEGGE